MSTDAESSKPSATALAPARILNEFAYCPRLAWLEWVQREWEDSSDTEEGKRIHKRVEQAEGPRARLH